MTAHVLTGSKQEIAEKVVQLQGTVRDAIVFIEEPLPQSNSAEEIFVEMEPFTVRQPSAADSREAIYQRMESE